MTSKDEGSKEISAREFGGYLYHELSKIYREKPEPFRQFEYPEPLAIAEFVMGVLANFDGYVVINDRDLPVEPIAIDKSDAI